MASSLSKKQAALFVLEREEYFTSLYSKACNSLWQSIGNDFILHDVIVEQTVFNIVWKSIIISPLPRLLII